MDSLVDEFLRVKNYERIRKRVQVEKTLKNYDLHNFMMFLQKRRKVRHRNELSFALNLETDSLKFTAKPAHLVAKSSKRKSKVTKKAIPKTFIKHILTLGFQESDSQVLYENKDDWLGMQKGRLITD